jgi:hypothetical protein
MFRAFSTAACGFPLLLPLWLITIPNTAKHAAEIPRVVEGITKE